MLFASLMYAIALYPLQLLIKLENNSLLEANENYAEHWVKIPIALPYTSHLTLPKGDNETTLQSGVRYKISNKIYQNDTLYLAYQQNSGSREVFDLLTDHLNHELNKENPHQKNNKRAIPILKFNAIEKSVAYLRGFSFVEKQNLIPFEVLIYFLKQTLLFQESPPPELG